MSDRNKDYFLCPKSNDLIKETGSMTFKDMDEFKTKVVEKVNSKHGGDLIGFVWNGKSQYAQLKCVFKDCPFSYWYQCESNVMPPKKIKFSRSIN